MKAGTIAAIVGALVLVGVMVGLILFGGPLVSFWKNRAADSAATAEHNADEATGAKLEVEGTSNLSNAASDLTATAATLRRKANAIDVQTRADPAAAGALPPGVVDRLRAADLELCAGAVLRCDDGPPPAP